MATASMILNLPQVTATTAPGASASSPSAATVAASKIGSVGVFRRLPLLGPVVRHAKVICLSTSGSGISHSLSNGLWPSAAFSERGMYGARGNSYTCGAGNADAVGAPYNSGSNYGAGGSGSNYTSNDTGAGGTANANTGGTGSNYGAGGGNESAPGTGGPAAGIGSPAAGIEDNPFTIGTKGNGIGGTRFNSISEMRIHYFGADIPGGPPPRKPDPSTNMRNPSGRGYSKGPGKTWPNPNVSGGGGKTWSNPNAGRTWPNPNADAGSNPAYKQPYQNQGMAAPGSAAGGPPSNTWNRPSSPPPYQNPGTVPSASPSTGYRSNDSWPANNAGSSDQWNRPTSTQPYQSPGAGPNVPYQGPAVGNAGPNVPYQSPGGGNAGPNVPYQSQGVGSGGPNPSTGYRSNDNWPNSNAGNTDQWGRPTSTQSYQNPGMGSPGSSAGPSTGYKSNESWPGTNDQGTSPSNANVYGGSTYPGANTGNADYGWKKGQTWPNPGEGTNAGGGDPASRGS